MDNLFKDILSFLEKNEEFIGLVFFGAFLLLVVVIQSIRNKSTFRTYENLANKYGGRLVRNFFSPKLLLPYEGKEITVFMRYGGKNSPPKTYFTAPIEFSRPFFVELAPENFLTKMVGIGLKDIYFDNPQFNEAFFVYGSDETLIRNLLAEDIQQRLLHMRVHKPSLIIRNSLQSKMFDLLQREGVSFHVPKLLNKEEEFDELIQIGLSILSRLRQIA